jgi:heptosyltransferase-2
MYRKVLARVASPRHILIATKYRFIGDTLLSIPAIRAVAELWPEAKVSVLTGSKALEALQHCPYVHDTIEFDPYRASDKGMLRFLATARELRKRHFDLVLVFNRSFHSALISVFGGGRVLVGWEGFDKRDFLLQSVCPYGREDCEIDSYLDIVRRAYEFLEGGPPQVQFDRRLEVWLTDQERENVAEELKTDSILIGMQPGASHDDKRWPVRSFAMLADDLTDLLKDSKIILVGGPEEMGVAEEMLGFCSEKTRSRVINLTGVLPLRQTLSTLTKLTYFIGNDTAIRHGAVSLNAPSLGLFGPTSVAKWGNPSPPLHQVIAAPSGRMQDISVEQVKDIVLQVIPTLEPERPISFVK